MYQIAESELILNSDGSIYHLNLLPEDLAETVITVGDPDRVGQVSQFFDNIELKKHKREFVTHTGIFKGKRLTVISTGIGTDNIDIVLNELDALVNIDLKTRQIKEEKTSLNIVRFGTSGSLQPEVEVDDFVVSSHAIGLDNLLHFYDRKPSLAEEVMEERFTDYLKRNDIQVPVYAVEGSAELMDRFPDTRFHKGITVTCSGFYGPQGRVLRLQPAFKHLIDLLPDFSHGNHKITNFEMESSGIYGLGRLLGHHCLSVNAIVANRVNHTFSKQPKKTVERMIEKGLEVLCG